MVTLIKNHQNKGVRGPIFRGGLEKAHLEILQKKKMEDSGKP